MEKTKTKHIELGEINYWLKVESSYRSSFIFTIVPKDSEIKEKYQQQYVFQLENDADANRLTASRGETLDCETLYNMMKDALLMNDPNRLEYNFYFTNIDEIDPYEDDILTLLEGKYEEQPLEDTSFLFISIIIHEEEKTTTYWIPFEAYPLDVDEGGGEEEEEETSMMGSTTRRQEMESEQYLEVIDALEKHREEAEKKEEKLKKQLSKMRHKMKQMGSIVHEQQVQMDLQSTKIEKLELLVSKLMETTTSLSRSSSFSAKQRQPPTTQIKKQTTSKEKKKKKFASVNRYSTQQLESLNSLDDEDDEDSFAAHPFANNHTKRRRSRVRMQQLHSARQKPHFFQGSKIVNSKQQATLNKFYGIMNQQWKLLFRASQNGWSARQFHAHCDNRGPTYILIATNNRSIFGGYCPVPMCSPPSGSEQTDYHPETFLFSLKNAYGHPPSEFRHGASSSPIVSVRHASNAFIHFGHQELQLPTNPNTRKCHSSLGTAFKNKHIKDEDTLSIYLAGANHFSCSEVEVWRPFVVDDASS